MDQYQNIAEIIAITMGVGWASGLNLYAAVFMLGVLGATGNIVLPPDLQMLSNPLVFGAAGLMYCVEFFADKIPGLDTGWDSIHTFIRIPGGALLAAGMVGDVSPAVAVAAGIMGGGLAAGSHAAKSGSRVMINTSPEPVTNWIASLSEDVAVFGGLWVALNHPYVFIGLLVVFLILLAWMLPKMWRGVKAVFRAIGRLFGANLEDPPGAPPAAPMEPPSPSANE